MKLLHPISFKKKYRLGLMLVILVVVIASVTYFFLANSTSTTKTTQIIKESALGRLLTLSPTPVPYITPGISFDLPKAKWVPQTFNNCGPAATAMVLQYFGFNVTQEETKAHLRTNPDDKNVFIGEISAYIKNDYGVSNKVLYNGDLKTIKTLVANGVYVVVEDWLHPNEDIGHVLIIHGFDDTEGVLIADDPFFGVGIKYPYTVWEEGQWKPYNREFMPVYKPDQENLVKSIIGPNWDEKTMFQNSVNRNQKDTQTNPNDMYAWFNLGNSYYALGEYSQAKDAFEKSQAIGWPHRLLWYFTQPVQNYNKLGLYQKAIDTANIGMWFNDNYAEMHYEKAYAYKQLGDTQSSKIEIQKTKELDPNFKDTYNLF